MKSGTLKASLVTMGLAVAFVAAAVAQAAGKKPATPDPASTPAAMQTPNPVRKVVLRTVQAKPFTLPNGVRVDLTTDLDALFLTAVTSTPNLSPLDAGSSLGVETCDDHIEVRAAVSTVDLGINEFGLRFGYTPGGEANPISSIHGSVTVRVGLISVDFSLWECVNGKCAAIAANTATHSTASTQTEMVIDFGTITLGPSFVHNTAFGQVMRAIFNDGVSRLASSIRVAELSWIANVREVIPGAGTLWFDSGTQSRLAPNQAFVVYAKAAGQSLCDVYKPVAYVHTTQVDVKSSVAVVDQMLDPRGIQAGDLIMVRQVNP